MYALIPGKDTLFELAACQRKIATAFSERYAPALLACPVCPLWAFTDAKLPRDIASCQILTPRLVQATGEIIFPLKLTVPPASSWPTQASHPSLAQHNAEQEPPTEHSAALTPRWTTSHADAEDIQEETSLSIVCARVLSGSTGWDYAQKLDLEWCPSVQGLPRCVSVFRTGEVEITGSSWRLLSEQWHKIKRSGAGIPR